MPQPRARRAFGLAALFLAFFITGTTARADDFENTLYKMKYKAQELSLERKTEELERIAAFVVSKHELFDMDRAFAPIRRAFNVDQIFTDANFEKTIFIKYGVSPARAEDKGQILSSGDGDYVFHGKNVFGTAFAVYFRGFSKVQINSYLIGLERPPKVAAHADAAWIQRASLFATYFLPRAEAKLDYCNDKSFSANATDLVKAVGSRGFKCLGDVAAKAMNVGESTLYAFSVGLFDGSTWAGIKGGWQTIQNLKSGFIDKMKLQYRNFFRLAPDTQAKIFCEFVGLAVGTVAVSMVTGGSGVAAAGATTTARIVSGLAAVNGKIRGADALFSSLEQLKSTQDDMKKIRCQEKIEDDDDDDTPAEKTPAKSGDGVAK